MSTVPPPFSYDPKAERRAAVLHARAQVEAFRAQKRLLREQHRSLRRSSILGPILLVAFGVLALLVSTGRWSALAFSGWYARWWPALLVLAGIILVAEWAFDHYLAQTYTAPPLRRRVGGGVITLLVLVALFGATSGTVHDQHEFLANAFSINHENLFELLGDKHDLPPQVLDQALPALTPGLMLTIDNPHGDITIVGKPDAGNLQITVNKQVYTTDSNAETKGDQLTPRFVASAGGLALTVPAVEGGSADISITVPESLALTLSANHGDINVTGIKAAVNATTNHGGVELQSITGNVTARINHSGSDFAAHNITGDVTLKGSVDDINLSDVSGKTYLEGSVSGDLHFERLRGPTTFQSSRTHFTLARIDGHVDIDDSNISGSQIAGPVSLRTRDRNISFDNLTGDLDLTSTNGTVDLNSAQLGNLTVSTTNDPISVTIPAGAGFTISAGTNSDIDNDFGLNPTKTGNQTSLAGSIGDARNHLSLQTTNADISLHKGPHN